MPRLRVEREEDRKCFGWWRVAQEHWRVAPVGSEDCWLHSVSCVLRREVWRIAPVTKTSSQDGS
ncbi:hypothetical protein A2U01_0118794, partial [Trifolium medium]|nr:hypothetical protein [Trifolium medium]